MGWLGGLLWEVYTSRSITQPNHDMQARRAAGARHERTLAAAPEHGCWALSQPSQLFPRIPIDMGLT